MPRFARQILRFRYWSASLPWWWIKNIIPIMVRLLDLSVKLGLSKAIVEKNYYKSVVVMLPCRLKRFNGRNDDQENGQHGHHCKERGIGQWACLFTATIGFKNVLWQIKQIETKSHYKKAAFFKYFSNIAIKSQFFLIIFMNFHHQA